MPCEPSILSESETSVLQKTVNQTVVNWVLKNLDLEIIEALRLHHESYHLACTTPEQIELFLVLSKNTPEARRIKTTEKNLKQVIRERMKFKSGTAATTEEEQS
jgi:hypothetical protein